MSLTNPYTSILNLPRKTFGENNVIEASLRPKGLSTVYPSATDLPNFAVKTPNNSANSVAKKANKSEGFDAIGSLLGLAGSTNPYATALSFLPGAAQVLGGLFGQNQTSEPTKVSREGLNNMVTDVNMHPENLENQRSFNNALEVARQTGGPNAGAVAKSMMTQTQLANNQLAATEQNLEAGLTNQKAREQIRLDTMDAQFEDQARRESDMVEGMLGPAGNIAMTGYQSIANAGTQTVRDRKASQMQALTALIGAKAIEGQSGAQQYLTEKLAEYSTYFEEMFNF